MIKNITWMGCALLAIMAMGCTSSHNLKPDREKYSNFSCQELNKEISVVVGYLNEAVGDQGLSSNTALAGFFFGGIGANLSNESAHEAADEAEAQKKFLYAIYDEKTCAEELYQLGKASHPSQANPTITHPSQGTIPNLVKGTGFLFSSSNFVITNFHLVRGAKLITVKLLHGQDIRAEIVAKDKNNDIAFLKLDSAPDMNIGKIALGDSAEVRPGDKVFTVGYPLSNILGDRPKYSEGVINAISGVGNDPRSFQISIPIQPGNSGGPLFNDDGDVIGVVTSSLDAETTSQVSGNIPQNVNFAIKSVFIKNLLPTLPETLISPTGLVPVPAYSESNRSNFVNQIQNNIVLLEIER